jgi:ATP-dependent DNA ligase
LFEYFTPQLCFNYKDLKPEEQKHVIDSEDWMADVKLDGLRCLIFYHPDYGFEFYSRDISEETFLPNNYTPKILIMHEGVVRTPNSFKGMFNRSFVLDGEVLVVNKNLDATKHGGGFSTTELNATVSILGGGADRARELQLEGNPLQFFVFDCLEFGDKDLKVLPLRERRVYLEKLINTLEDKVPFKIPDCTVFNKMKFFDDIVSGGGEGIVLKSLEQPYFVSTI